MHAPLADRPRRLTQLSLVALSLVALSLVALSLVALPLAGCGEQAVAVPLFDATAFYGPAKVADIAFAGGGARVAPPMSLTASDGTGLRLTQLRAQAVVEGPLAFTELHLTFHNPENRQREGRFSITLPPSAAVNRFAMYTDKWMEGEVVEKQQARRIYEDYLHRKQDPALLETGAGNTFRARVFPIPAGGDKKLIVSFTTELARASDPYVLPLAGLGELKDLEITVAVHHQVKAQAYRGPRVVQVQRQAFTPARDLVVHPQAANGPSALRNGDLVATRITLPTNREKQRFSEVVVLFDTSASEAVNFKGRVTRLEQLLTFVAQHGAQQVTVLAFDQVGEPVFSGPPAKWGEAERTKLLERGALGASDWGAALSRAGKLAKGRKDVRVIAFGNGVATAGLTAVDELKRVALSLNAVGVQRLDTVEMAAQRDMASLRAIATAGLPHDGVHVQLGTKPKPGEFDALLAATFRPIRVAVKGAAWVWPQALKGLKGGDSAVVFAQHEGDDVEVELSGGATQRVTVRPQLAARALLQTAWVSARIKRLLHDSAFGDPDMRPMAKQQALKLSIKHRVLCELTALLVLESEREYARYNLKQTALADILTVTPDLEVAALDRAHAYESERRRFVPRVDPVEVSWLDKLKATFASKSDEQATAAVAPSAGSDRAVEAAATPRSVAAQRAEIETETAKDHADDGVEGERAAAAMPQARGGAPSPSPGAHPTPRDMPPQAESNVKEKKRARRQDAPSAEARPNNDVRMAEERKPTSQGPAGALVGGSGGGGSAGAKGVGLSSRTGPGPHNGDLFFDKNAAKRKVSVSVAVAGLDGAKGPRTAVARVLARRNGSVRRCYELYVRRNPNANGAVKVIVAFTVGTAGTMTSVDVRSAPPELGACIKAQFLRIRGLPLLPRPQGFSQRYNFQSSGPSRERELPGAMVQRSTTTELAAKKAQARANRERARLRKQRRALAVQAAKLAKVRLQLETENAAKEAIGRGKRELEALRAGIANTPNIKGPYAKIRSAIDSKKLKTALRTAWDWRRNDPANVMALVALGDAYLALEEPKQAARAYGSLIDLFPSRADLRRFAGNLLDTTDVAGHRLAIDTYRAAVKQRPDHPAGYHMLAMTLAQDGQLQAAIDTLEAGIKAKRRSGNFRGVDRILNDDLRMVRQARDGGGGVPPNIRFVLTWETDANDVDFHIFDSDFEHASFRQRQLKSGGELFADITTGYGPECFRIDNPTQYPYQLLAHYYAMGPMGYGMGRLQVVRYDGKKGFGVESRPFVIMQNRSYVDMGEVTAKTAPVNH